MKLLALLAVITVSYAYEKYYDGHIVVQVMARNAMQAEALLKMNENLGYEYDFWKRPTRIGRPADIMVPPEKIDEVNAYFKKNLLRSKVVVPDLGKLVRRDEEAIKNSKPFTAHIVLADFDFYQYYAFADQMTYIQGVAQQYSDFVSISSMGKSLEGRDTQFLKIGYPSNGTKNAFWIDAGIHAREWIAPALALYTINQLVTDKQYVPLLQAIDIYVAPNANPDGYEFSRTGDRMWRKNRSGPRQNCYGVDLNRNFPFKWGVAGTSNNPCDETYLGPSPLSEIEAQNLAGQLNKVNNTAKAMITLHSYAEDILYPWGYAVNTYPPDVADLKALGQKFVAAVKAVHKTKYTNEVSAGLYPASGASDDYSKSIGIKYVYTVELRPGTGDTDNDDGYGFELPASFIQRTCEETFPALLVVANAVQNGPF